MVENFPFSMEFVKDKASLRGLLQMADKKIYFFMCFLLFILIALYPFSFVVSQTKGAGGDDEKFRILRGRMVREQITAPPDYRDPVKDEKVISAMLSVPRNKFVRPQDIPRAYGDHPIPIGYGQTISQPYIVALMSEMLDVNPEHIVLEVGTGSGYQAAVLSGIVKEVYTVEIVEALGKRAYCFS